MALIKYTEIDGFLENPAGEDMPRVFLLWGEPYLVREKTERVVSALLPGDQKTVALERIEGEEATVTEVVDTLTTLCMFLQKRVVAVKEPPFLQTGGTKPQKEQIKRLTALISKGLPVGTFLIISAAAVDRRGTLFKCIRENGIAVDCTVPTGARQSDIQEQNRFLKHISEKILKFAGKTMDGDGFRELVELTGFEPATFADNVKKLVAFTGEKKRISAQDVSLMVGRTRQAPVFDFTNALFEKDIKRTLFSLNSLMRSGFHPLQVLKATANQLRKVFAAKSFIETVNRHNRDVWTKDQPFNRFRQVTLPEVAAVEKSFAEGIDPVFAKSDLFLAPTPRNAYPLYQTFRKADHFSFHELERMLSDLGDLDAKLKSSSANPWTRLEDFAVRTCADSGSRCMTG